MRKGMNELKEIVWEISGKCNNNCEYCGSKKVWGDEIDDMHIVKIAEKIAEYPPKELSISGGDPTLVPLSVHEKIAQIFTDKAPNMMPKILINPKSFVRPGHEIADILKLYKWVGISINTKEELEIARQLDMNDEYCGKVFETKTTFITNFNVTNIFLFDEIKKFVKGNPWTVQYTIYENEEDSKAIYNNDEAVNFLKSKIDAAIKEKVQIIISDDMSGNPCWAGTSVCGITSDGDVVPCLSMRAWAQVKDVVQGNVLKFGLKSIWENEFNNYRFGCFKCCKDHCKNKAIGEYVSDKNIKDWESFLENLKKNGEPIQIDPNPWNPPPTDNIPQVVAYAVSPPGTYVYAVSPPGTYVYAVWSPENTPLVYAAIRPATPTIRTLYGVRTIGSSKFKTYYDTASTSSSIGLPIKYTEEKDKK